MSKANKSFKKTVRQDVISRLQSTLGDLEQSLGKNKFRRRIKKATKVLVADLKKSKSMKGEPILLTETVTDGSAKKSSRKKAKPPVEAN